jgi:hypothetical protein
MKKHLVAALTLFASGAAVLATSVSPTYDTFGTLSGATFGGTGIPNDNVAIATTTSGITLGLSATQRYFNPPLGNDGAGTFYATPGENTGLANPPKSVGPTWNFDIYLGNTGQGAFTYKLIYGNNTTGNFSTLDLTGLVTLGNGLYQDSWNLDMAFLNTIGYDPNASGVYAFELEALNVDGRAVAQTAINVDVGQVPDSASTILLLGCGFLGLAFFRSSQFGRMMAK